MSTVSATSSRRLCSRRDWCEATGYFERPKQVKETKTATGGEIKTDGRTLVIVLKP